MRRLTSVGSVSPSPRRAFRPLVRQRISGLLDSAYQYPVTVLIAGAGYGKSVALEHWLAGKQETVIRYNVREGTHGIFDFTLGLAQALSPTVKLSAKNAAAAVNAAEKSERPEFDLANWFENGLRKFTGTIVIDDFHVAGSDDPAVARLLEHLIAQTSGKVRWIIASRSSCGLPVTSWIAYGKSQMALGERDLAFTHEEAAEAVSEAGAGITPTQLNELYAYTSGWPTALAFALLSSERTFDIEELRVNTRELSYKYLAEQVLRGLSDADVQFMLQTSVFDRLTVETLELAGFSEPRKRLNLLRENATFVISESDGSARYHDLFRDFLRAELSKHDAGFRAAWSLAGSTYERMKDYSAALEAYLASGDCEHVLRVLQLHGFFLIDRGRRRAVARALDAIDGRIDAGRHAAILALQANCALNAGNPEGSEVLYRRAIEVAVDPEERATLALQFARELVQLGRLDGIPVLEQVLIAELPIKLSISIRGTLATYYSQAAKPGAAFAMVEAAMNDAAAVIDDEVRAIVMHQYAYILVMNGQLKKGEEQAARALALATALELPALCARIHSLLYYVSASADNVAQAFWWAKQMERSSADAGDAIYRFSSLAAMYELDVERGNLDPLAVYNERLREFEAHRYYGTSQGLLPSFALQAAWQGRFDDAVDILKDTERSQVSQYRRALRAAEIALYAAASGKREIAEELAAYSQKQMSTTEAGEPYAPKRHAKALVYMGLGYMLLGKMSLANRYIGEAERISGLLSDRFKALVRASRQMFVHVETRGIEAEVESAFDALTSAGFGGISRMLRALPIPSLDRERTSASLTRAEIDVLRAIERNVDSKAAAAELGKSSHTVDWHVKSIMRKLQVKSRREAIAFARKKGLIH